MLSCYPSYLSYDILFFVLDGLYCCLVSEMNDRSVAIFFFVLIMIWLWEGISVMYGYCLELIFSGSWI